MTQRRLVPLYLTLGAAAILALVAFPFLSHKPPAPTADASPTTRRAPRGNPMANPPGMVDRLVMLDTRDTFSKGKLTDVEISPAGALVMPFAGEPANFPKRATYLTEEVTTDFPFTELIPSWNALCPPDTGVYFEVRSRDAKTQEWSPWMYIGYWGRVRAARKVDRFDLGQINTDNLTLTRPADAWQMKAVFQSFDPKGQATPTLRRLAISYSGVVADESERDRLTWKPEIAGNWAVDLNIPYRPQGDSTKALAGEICSPTSVSMVMQHLGVDRPTVENALAIYDEDSGIFGNWSRAAARAGELGFDAYVTRFRNWDQVKATIAQGQPIICSIKAKKGDFQGPYIYESTNGHLVVLRGLTPEGNCIINDPARRAKGNGFVYNQADIQRVWIDHGGVGYIIRKPANATPATTQPIAKSGA